MFRIWGAYIRRGLLSEFYGMTANDYLHQLMSSCRVTDAEAKILVAECLGELGAVDPGRSVWLWSCARTSVELSRGNQTCDFCQI